MAEFTEFMNQRVEHFFSMFKELRSGSISYPEIAKRENVRPPINKVCQKLGVKKVAQMTSDEQLLQAIKDVVYDIEMKRKLRTGAEAAKNDIPQAPVPQLQPIPVSALVSGPPGLTKVPAHITSTAASIPASFPISIPETKKAPPGINIASSVSSTTPSVVTSAQDSETDDPSGDNSGVPIKRLEKLPRAPPALPCDSLDLLNVVLAVRASNGRLQKAWQEIQQNPDISPEVADLSTQYIQSVIKSLCALIGCRRLDIAISYEETINAFERYVRHSREGVAAAARAAKSAVAAASAAASTPSAPAVAAVPSGTLGSAPSSAPGSALGGAPVPPSATVMSTPLSSQQPQVSAAAAPASTSAVESSIASAAPSKPAPALSVVTSSPHEQRHKDAYSAYKQDNSPASSGAGSGTGSSNFSPRAPNNTTGGQHSRQNSGVFSAGAGGPSDTTGGHHSRQNSGVFPTASAGGHGGAVVSNSTSGGKHSRQDSGAFSAPGAAPGVTATAPGQPAVTSGNTPRTPRTPMGPPRPLEEVYGEFWELAYKLFLYVCNPYRHCHECLCVVEDIVNCLDSTPNLASPLTALALDSVIQRAMYELSDKVSRPLDDTALQCLSDVAATAPDCSVRNIELCIALMSRNVSPACARIRDEYYQRNQLPPPPAGSVWCDKVLTLTRQLQELIAWSSPHCQARVPAFIPAGQFAASAPRDTLFTDRSQSGHAPSTSPRDASVEAAVTDYLSQLTPAAAAEVMASLREKDAVLSDLLQQISTASVLPQLPPDLGKSLQTTLQKLTRQTVADCTVTQCGAASLGFYDVVGKIKLDFVVLSAPYHVNIHDLAGEDQVQELTRTSGLAEQLRELERAVEMEKLTEIAWKHLKACVRDFHTQSQDFIIKLTTKESAQESPRNGFNNQHYQAGRRGYDAPNGAQGGYQGNPKYDLQAPQYGAGGSYQQPGYASQGPAAPPPELILEIAEDAELMRRTGDGVVEMYHTLRTERIAATPVVPQILQKAEEVQNQVDRPEREKANFIRKFCKTLDRVLKDNRFLYVRVVSNKVRFTHINFEHQVGPQLTVSCNVLACNPLPIQTTRLIFEYIAADRSGKIRDYLQTIKLFAAAHHISDPASGYLSTTAWYVMALHVLLKHEIVPNLHMHRLYHTAERATPPGNNRAAPATWELTAEYQERLRGTPLLVLLDRFFRYYVEQVNIFTGVVTLRDQGAVLPKTKWPGNPVLWRISVEDPFECIGSAKPYDLGCTLSRPGQLTTYKALRRAVYGIHSLMADPAVDCRESMKKLFSRVELINLARRSDYMGAVITASPAWVRPSSTSVLDAPQYGEYTFSLLRQFETPEGQEKLMLLGDAGLGSENGSPNQPPGKRMGTSPQALSAKAPTFQPGGPAPAPAPMGQNRAPVQGGMPPPTQQLQDEFRGGNTAGYKTPNGVPPNVQMSQYSRAGTVPPPPQPYHPQYPGHALAPGQGPGQQYAGPNVQTGYPAPHQQPRQAYMDGRQSYAEYGQPEDFRPQHQQPYQYPPPPHAPQQQRAMYPPHASPQMQMQMQGYQSPAMGPPPQQYAVYGGAQQPQPPQPHYQYQHQQNYQREGQYSNQPPPQAGYVPSGQQSQYPGQNQGRPQASQYPPAPAQYGAADSRDPRSQHPAPHNPQQRGSSTTAHPTAGAAPAGPQAGRPFDPTAAALAAAAERRYPVNQLQSAQQFDPKNRRPGDPPVGPARQEQQHQPPLQQQQPFNNARNAPAAPRAPEKDRYDATLSARYAPDDRAALDSKALLESRYVPSLALPSGSMTGRAADGPRHPEDSRYPSGSASARYPTLDDRNGSGLHPASTSSAAALDFSVRGSEERNIPAVPHRAPLGLPQGLKLDLQPRFAEDRYMLSENDPIVDFAAPQTSARQQSLTPAQAAIGKGDLSARRGSDGTIRVSPRDASLSISTPETGASAAQSKKSPVVPLIPLEGISGFSSSASSSDYGNALHSDRSSMYLGTGRSDMLADTGRSTIIPSGANTSGSLFGALGTGRTSAINAIGLSTASMPNTSRSVGEFALHRSLDSADDFHGGNTGRDDDIAGLCLSSRGADDLLDQPGRSSALTEQNLADAQPTNRLSYMGLDDLRRGPGLPLATIRSAAPSSNGSQQARSSSEFDMLLERINADSLGSQARRNSSSSGSSNVPYLADFAPPNSARGSSGRGSNASLGHLMEGLDFGYPLISPRQQLTPRREPNLSLLGSIAETPLSPDMPSHKSLTASRALPLGLLNSPSDASNIPAGGGLGAATQGSSAYMKQLFNNNNNTGSGSGTLE